MKLLNKKGVVSVGDALRWIEVKSRSIRYKRYLKAHRDMNRCMIEECNKLIKEIEE